MRVYYDCEFRETGRIIDLISIGLVWEDGSSYYAVSSEFDMLGLARDPWLSKNVWPHLPKVGGDQRMYALASIPLRGRWTRKEYLQRYHTMRALFNWESSQVKSRATIRQEVAWALERTPDLELWSWYGAYDHVALAQLWGRMLDLPEGLPMYTRDLQQEADRLGFKIPDQPALGQHHALTDARYHAQIGRMLDRFAVGADPEEG